MFNLFFILISSLCINFAAITYPYDVFPTNSANEVAVDTMLSILSQNNEGWIRGYAQSLINHKENLLVVRDGSGYDILFPIEVADGEYSSSFICTSRDDQGHVSFGGSNLGAFIFNSDYSYNSVILFVSGTSITLPEGLFYTKLPFPYSGIDTFYENDVLEIPSIGLGSGSLGSTGHSSGGSPIDELNNSGVTWSPTQGTFTSTGHSIQNVTTPPSADPNSNLELILSGFLGGILNNTNNLLGNTSQLGSILGGVSNNVIQGSSAIFNGISNLNNTIMEFIAYIREPLDQERISAKLEEVPIYQTINSFVGFSDSFLSAINSIQDPEHLYLTMDFRNANEPFRRLGLYVFDFTFLDNLKSTWQPILLAILYVTLGVNIFYDLPNIVHGISGLSGGDE